MSPPLPESTILQTLSGPHKSGAPAATVALVGPPNCGKSTLFNRLTGLRQKTANFPGVTVERHHGTVRLSSGKELEILDLPGTYSLTPRSEDERITDDLLRGKMPHVCVPDAILLVLDSTNLGRHLVLAAPMLALEKPILIVLNMADELRQRGGDVDVEALSERLGTPVVLVSAAKGEGLEGISQFLESTFKRPAPIGAPRASESAVLQAVGRAGRCRLGLPAAGSASLDSAPRFGLPPPLARAGGVHVGGGGRFPDHLLWRHPLHERGGGAGYGVGRVPQGDAAGFRDEGPSGGGGLGWGRVGPGVPSPDSPPLPLHWHPGGLRLSGPGRGHRRQDHGQGRAPGKIVHPPSVGLCLCRAGHHGHPDHREQKGSARHHTHRALHDLCGPAPRLHPDHRGVPSQRPTPGAVPGNPGGGPARDVPPGIRCGIGDGPDPEVHRPEERTHSIRHGASHRIGGPPSNPWGSAFWIVRRSSSGAQAR